MDGGPTLLIILEKAFERWRVFYFFALGKVQWGQLPYFFFVW